MSESQDQWLAKLFDQSERQHVENRSDIKQLLRMVADLLETDGKHGARLDILEKWRSEVADPFFSNAKDGVSQVKGAGKALKIAAASVVGVTSVAGIATAPSWLGKLLAAFLSSLPK